MMHLIYNGWCIDPVKDVWYKPQLPDILLSYEEAKMVQRSLELDATNPSHYKDVYPFEVIDLIQRMMTPEQFVGYCLGNELKYRLRAGNKDPDRVVEDIKKAEWYNNKRVEFIFNQGEGGSE